ncbi:MAG: ATP-binding protein [Magnetospirillum sp. WYHS-4]
MLFGIGVAAAVVVALAVALLAGRQQALDAGRAASVSLARAATDSTARIVQSVDVVLASVAEAMLQRQSLGDGAVAEALRQRLLFSPQLRQILVVDSEGRVLFDTAGTPAGTTVEAAGLLAAHRDSVRPLVIGKPLAQRFVGGGAGGGQYLIPMTRTFRDSRGGTGLLIAAINPQHVQSIFDALETGEGGTVSLHHFDGTFLAGTGLKIQPGDSSREHEPFRSLVKDAEFGSFSDVDPDGRRRLASYRMTLVWPLVIGVSLSEEAILASWRQGAESLAGPVVAVALVVLGLTGVLARLLVRRVRDEEALLLSDMALAHVADGVTITDALAPDNPLVYVNPAFRHITGYDAAQVFGRNPRFLHGEDRGQEGLEAIRLGLADGGSATAVLRNYRKDGSLFWNELTVTAVPDGSGRIVHYVGVQRDITPRVESEARLRKSLAETAHAHAELARFSEILAHHMQEPVRSLVSFTQLLGKRLGDQLGPSEREYMDFTVAAALHLKRLLRDVELYLSVDRLPAGEGMFSAEAALNEALRRLKRQIMSSGGSVTATALPEVRLDIRRLAEIFARLIENSLTYCPGGRLPEVSVSARWDEETAVFRVEDNGAGIPPEYRERVFRVFERLETGDRHEGTGIGLSLVRKIVTLAGGTVAIEARPQGGTAVVFTLPRQVPGLPGIANGSSS